MNLIQIPLLLMPLMIHIPTRLLLSVVKNVIQLFFLIHPMISRIYIGWHRKVLCYMLNWLARVAAISSRAKEKVSEAAYLAGSKTCGSYSNSQNSICFIVFLHCFSFETVRFRTVLYVFAMFSSTCIVILLSVMCNLYLKIN